jgi:hypothetical protein
MKLSTIVFGVLRTLGGPAFWFGLSGCRPVGAPSSGPFPSAFPTPQRFELVERFGVSHPEQIVTFDLPSHTPTSGVWLVNDVSNAVPFQFVEDGRTLAVRTDLPAYATRSWTLTRAPAGNHPGEPEPSSVIVTETDRFYEITNDRTGVRVTKPQPLSDMTAIPAPVQGIRLADGTWTATGPNYLTVKTTAARAMAVRFVERGPLVTTVEVSYQFDRPDDWHPIVPNLGRAGGDGYYRSTITLQAGQPSVLFEEDTDMELSYQMNLYAGVQPDQARYRGHSSPDPKYGYTPDGTPYAGMAKGQDAFVDLQYERPQMPGMFSDPNHWSLMVVWNIWWAGSGPYWQLYNKDAPETANLVGIFTGRASRGTGTSVFGAGIFTRPPEGGSQPQAGVGVVASHWSPNNQFFPHIRFQWGLFSSTKRDLLPYDQVQPIARQMNLHGGINLDKVHRWTADFPDPPGGYDSFYLRADAMRDLRRRLQNDEAFCRRLWSEFSMSRDIYELLQDADGGKAHEYTAAVTDVARRMLNALVNGDGIYDFAHHYWHGGLIAQRHGEAIAVALGHPNLLPEDRARLKAVAAFFANVLWDNDFVPLDNHQGFNLGTANMPQMFSGFRHFYALFLANHPMMKERVARLAADAPGWVRSVLNDAGAPFSGSGYQHAALAPPLNVWQRLQTLGLADVFRDEPRLTRYADFYLNLFTPPDPRFGARYRQLICLGDTSISGGPGGSFPAQLATCLAPWHPAVGARLMRLWQETGAGYDLFFGCGLIKVDHRLPAAESLALQSADFPGYYSVLRSGAGTPNETAVWMVNGDFYRDHRHPEMGNVIIYALGAPLAVDMGTNYDPLLNGATHHNVAIPEKHLGRPWDKEPTQLNDCFWEARDPEPAVLLRFPDSSVVRAGFRNPGWSRTARLLHANPVRPVIVVEDRFSAEPPEPWVLHWNLMAEGPVQTPAGPYTPEPRLYSSNNRPDGPKQVPSVGPVVPITAGVHLLRFTGYPWGQPTQSFPSVDFDVALVAPEPQEFHLGNWAHEGLAGGGHVFQQINGRPFEERQHRLCVRGRSGFTTVILPLRKGEPSTERTVTMQDGAVRIAWQDEETLVGGHWHAYRKGEMVVVLTLLDRGRAEWNGLALEGGPMELALDLRAGTATLTAHGAPGPRAVALPGNWQAPPPLRRDVAGWTWNYPGGAPETMSFHILSK